MKRLLLLVAVIAVCFAPARAVVVTVLVSDFVFTPKNAVAHVGDTIRWVWSAGDHTTTSGSIPTGASSWDALISSTHTVFDYKLMVAGTYNYVCTPHVGLGMTGTITVSPTGITPQQKLSVRMSPNPANEKLEISIPDLNQTAPVQLVDITGKIIFQDSITPGNALVIQTREYPTGAYQVRLQVGDIRQIERIVIQH